MSKPPRPASKATAPKSPTLHPLPESLLTPKKREDDLEQSIRPLNLSEFIGQRAARANMSIFIESAKKVYADAQAMLAKIIDEKWLTARGVCAFWPARRDGDDDAPGREVVAQVAVALDRRHPPVPERDGGEPFALGGSEHDTRGPDDPEVAAQHAMGAASGERLHQLRGRLRRLLLLLAWHSRQPMCCAAADGDWRRPRRPAT